MSDLGTVTFYREADLDYRRERLAADFRPLLPRRAPRRPGRAARLRARLPQLRAARA